MQCSDVLETLSLIFCGADVNCSTGMASCPSPLSLASAHSQPLQVELITHNLNTGTVQMWSSTSELDWVFVEGEKNKNVFVLLQSYHGQRWAWPQSRYITQYHLVFLTMVSCSRLAPWLGLLQSARPERVSSTSK